MTSVLPRQTRPKRDPDVLGTSWRVTVITYQMYGGGLNGCECSFKEHILTHIYTTLPRRGKGLPGPFFIRLSVSVSMSVNLYHFAT
jgi:hypothetical protein